MFGRDWFCAVDACGCVAGAAIERTASRRHATWMRVLASTRRYDTTLSAATAHPPPGPFDAFGKWW
jgi:hypothetical protein